MTSDVRLVISLADQQLSWYADDELQKSYAVSTAANGPGQLNGSACTPLGAHTVRARIGAGQARDTVFVGRRPTGETYNSALRLQYPDRDWILTRILWLSGLQPGVNRLGQVDTMRRYIYIHGAPDDVPMGTPGSAGCIRMNNDDVIELFDFVPAGARVDIVDGMICA